MIISNSSNSGNIGIGKDFNNPEDKLHIKGNTIIDGNGVFTNSIILKEISDNNLIPTKGMIVYDKQFNLFKGYTNKWIYLSQIDNLSLKSSIGFKSDHFHFSLITSEYQFGNRITELNHPSENIIGDYKVFNYQYLNNSETITINKIILGNNKFVNGAEYTIEIFINNTKKTTQTITTNTQNNYNIYEKDISNSNIIIESTATQNILSIKIKGNDKAIDSNIIVTLLGKKELGNITISGNTNILFDENIIIKKNVNINKSLIVEDNIGLNIDNPQYPLHITKSQLFNGDDISIKTDGKILIAGTVINSDERIKTNITNTNLKDDYETIKNINPVFYNYKNNLNNNKVTRGLVAQEIENYIPNAIKEITEYIPNIMESYYIYSNNSIISNKLKLLININDNIKYIYNKKEYFIKVIDIDIESDIIYFSESIIKDEFIFIYGIEVNNFKVLDYEYINNILLGAVKYIINKIDLD